MPSLHYADHKPLAEHLARSTRDQAQVRQIIISARLEPTKISLPDGQIFNQWWNAIQYADSMGDRPLTCLLTAAAETMPRLLEGASELLRRYEVDVAALEARELRVDLQGSDRRPRSRTADSQPCSPPGGRRRILFLSANSTHTRRLDIEEEHHYLDRSLRIALGREAYEFATEMGVRPRDLGDILRRHALAVQGKIVLHFSGHGNEAGSGLLMRSDRGRDVLVSDAAFGRLFRDKAEVVELVVLNACHSADHALQAVRSIGAAIGMTGEIHDTSAIVFSQVFYRALASHSGIAEAFDEACTAIDLEGLAGWDVPVLYLKDQDGVLRARRACEDLDAPF